MHLAHYIFVQETQAKRNLHATAAAPKLHFAKCLGKFVQQEVRAVTVGSQQVAGSSQCAKEEAVNTTLAISALWTHLYSTKHSSCKYRNIQVEYFRK